MFTLKIFVPQESRGVYEGSLFFLEGGLEIKPVSTTTGPLETNKLNTIYRIKSPVKTQAQNNNKWRKSSNEKRSAKKSKTACERCQINYAAREKWADQDYYRDCRDIHGGRGGLANTGEMTKQQSAVCSEKVGGTTLCTTYCCCCHTVNTTRTNCCHTHPHTPTDCCKVCHILL